MIETTQTPGEFSDLEQLLAYQFRDCSLLRLALTHPSVAHEQPSPLKTNQRLEFLGDSVLQLVLSRELYDRFPEVEEGALTKARAKLVNSRSLADRARHIDLGRYLLVSRGRNFPAAAIASRRWPMALKRWWVPSISMAASTPPRLSSSSSSAPLAARRR